MKSRSDDNNNGNPVPTSQLGMLSESPNILKKNFEDESFNSELALSKNKQYFSEKYNGQKRHMVMIDQRIIKDDMSIVNYKTNVTDDNTHPAMTP